MDHFENLMKAQASKASAANKPKVPSAQLMQQQR